MTEGAPPAPSNPPHQVPVQTVVLQPRESYFGKLGKWLFLPIVLLLMVVVALTAQFQTYFNEPGGPQERFHSLSKTATDKIAIISVSGTIMEGNEFVKQQIDRVKKDDKVVGVVLRINSPGGTVTYSDYLLHHLQELVVAKEEKLGEGKFPVVVSMGSICASGGYYIAMAVGDAEDVIFAEETTWTGSIGVIIPHYDLSTLVGRIGIEEDSIASGKFKQMGSPTREMTEEERALFQELVDETFKRFKDVVLSGRPEFRTAPEALDKVATGQIFTAGQALDYGLIDKKGFIEDAIDRAVTLAGATSETIRCVKFVKQPAAIDVLLGEASAAGLTSRGADLRGLLELSTPRAYYLYSLAPTLVGSAR